MELLKHRNVKSCKKKKNKFDMNSISSDLTRLEFHRHGLALVPELKDSSPGIAFLVKNPPPMLDFFRCTCRKKGGCGHLQELELLAKKLRSKTEEKVDHYQFVQSSWYHLARVLAENCAETPDSVRFIAKRPRETRRLSIKDQNNNLMMEWLADTPDLPRLKDRFGEVPQRWEKNARSKAIRCLLPMVYSENEKFLNKRGSITRKQDLEGNFWHRFAYHGFREFGFEEIILTPEIDDSNGEFSLIGQGSGKENIFRLIVPRSSVKKILTDVLPYFRSSRTLEIHPQRLRPHFQYRMIGENELEITPLVSFPEDSSDSKEFDIGSMVNFTYGDLVYLKGFDLMVRLEKPDRFSPVDKNQRTLVTGDKIPHFLCEFEKGRQMRDNKINVPGMENLSIHQTQFNLKITPDVLERDWCWLSFDYTFGQSSLSLHDILEARRKRKRFIKVDGGWVDCDAPHFQEAEMIFNRQKDEEGSVDASRLKLTRLELLRLSATAGPDINVEGKKKVAELVEKFVNLQPTTPLPSLKHLVTPLRHYQEHGVNWLWYLFENRLGGLLCDDMGLGKTHQIMALIAILVSRKKNHGPCLVVCPTTVISHWNDKLRKHTPSLNVGVYYGSERKLDSSWQNQDVIVTSYGVLRIDIWELQKINFTLTVFDEAQYLKNPQTQAHLAALELNSLVKVGLTGTPIENSVLELKALFDLVLPGYLGTKDDFEGKYSPRGLFSSNAKSTKQLQQVISPFVLRRLKKTVLDELPDKIEDTRRCLLSQEQIKLYREAIKTKGRGLLSVLETTKQPIPYIHIFALLTILKQICDHPAIAIDKVDQYEEYASGKWELFKELLSESLESGQKVVIFSQFLNMIKIIEKYLESQEIGFVTLTGASRKRGKIVDQFNNDDRCRVFIGSLMAGGTGIDLIAGSVVIHYDRWWNAAREDQATDRLHRIGQKNVVQVFKLVTKGTLEEKISAIIEKKRNLMKNIVKDDNPNVLKTLSREDLIDLISNPA